MLRMMTALFVEPQSCLSKNPGEPFMMKCANQTADIMDRIFTDMPKEKIPGLSELSEFIYQRDRPTSPILNEVKTNAQSRSVAPEKKKVTYYLSKQVCVELSEANAKIKVQVPQKLKRKVSMSRIVDFAIKAILDEFNQGGADSSLVREILSDM